MQNLRVIRLSIVMVFSLLVGKTTLLAAEADKRREKASKAPPNVVLIMTDNVGAWTFGCYGNKDIRTPHIDSLANDGMLFTRAFSSNAVCSPTRATYLTGLLPSQHGVHCFLTRNGSQVGPNAASTIREFQSLPKILAASGYHCGLVGKWHLGGNLTPQDGFRDWITMPHGATSTFYGAEVVEDGKIRREPKYLTDLWTERAVKFIEGHHDKPFFLFLSYNGPYGLGRSLLQPSRNRHAAYYADKWLPSFPRGVQHPWLHNNKQYLNNIDAIRRFAAELSAVDDGVGRVTETLKQHGLDENTLVIFCADQGWMGGQNGIWGMGDHTRPLTAFDGMMHIPMIFRHPGQIAAGSRSGELISNYDFLPTMLGQLGLEAKPAQQPDSPGRDFSPALRGEAFNGPNAVFYEMENVRAIRTNRWKYVHRHPDGPFELYDLTNDPYEKVNLFGQPAQAEVQREFAERLAKFFDEYADPKYDLYKGGESKTPLISRKRKQPR